MNLHSSIFIEQNLQYIHEVTKKELILKIIY